VEDCDDLNKLGLHAIHDPVIPLNHFAERFIADLRNHPPRKRKGIKSIHRGHDTFHEQVRIVFEIPRHEGSDASTSSTACGDQNRWVTEGSVA
jgi:hypothetical protein